MSLELPVELWLTCWLQCSQRQLRRLSLVCKLFRSICLPLVIQDQSADIAALDSRLAPRNWMEKAHLLHRMAVRLDRFAAQGPQGLASAVRSWKFSRLPSSVVRIHAGSGTPDLVIEDRRNLETIVHIGVYDALRDRVMTTFLATLGLYQNLRCMHVAGMTVDLTWRERLWSLSNLEELALDGCEILPRDGTVLRISHFTLAHPRAGSIAPPQGQLRIVDPGAGLPSLLSLSLQDFSVRNIPSFLARCPQLQSLTVLSPTLDGPLELLGHIAPALSTLIAEAETVPLFAASQH
ncbi:hypothetical protein FB45DRAFT_1103319 [Roridomyces roridus]|uniref:F-box domain-containing protein n=1 Tax=Roridomyces roridus TaxID=1738132 RepID=A0AAD7BE32_9AGAR|nr:hypothetical protein FB45DRAFT_1103319 [Roridomyces roridus]